MTERRERGKKSDVDANAARSGGVHVLWKTFPVPGETPVEDLVRNRLHMNEVSRCDITLRRFARRQSDAAIAHESPWSRRATTSKSRAGPNRFAHRNAYADR